MADKEKFQEERKGRGPQMARPGLGLLGKKKKKKKTLGEEQYETFKSESDTQFDKAKRIQKSYEGASPKIKTDLKKRFKGTFDPEDMVASSRRDTAKTFKVGGRVGLKDGSKGCGKAKAGRGKAYGKNS